MHYTHTGPPDIHLYMNSLYPYMYTARRRHLELFYAMFYWCDPYWVILDWLIVEQVLVNQPIVNQVTLD